MQPAPELSAPQGVDLDINDTPAVRLAANFAFLAVFAVTASSWLEPNACEPQPFLSAAAFLVPVIARPRWHLLAWVSLTGFFGLGTMVLFWWRLASALEPSFYGEWTEWFAVAGPAFWFAGVGCWTSAVTVAPR